MGDSPSDHRHGLAQLDWEHDLDLGSEGQQFARRGVVGIEPERPFDPVRAAGAEPSVRTSRAGKSEFDAWRDAATDPPALMIRVGSTTLSYLLRSIEDLHAMLVEHGGWIPLGNADKQKAAKSGTVEGWARAADNPVGGWYGLRKGYRGRFGNYFDGVADPAIARPSCCSPPATAHGRIGSRWRPRRSHWPPPVRIRAFVSR
ncbi:MAG: hypothetical protein H0V64_11485 [Geodermatophilaceae bacterium]|nr:hypothetical protein [Geodermatophilaceae bacterium]